jgi:hypothetical protein
MSDAVLDPDPPDKPPARTYAEAVPSIATLTIGDPNNPDAYVQSDTGVMLEDVR